MPPGGRQRRVPLPDDDAAAAAGTDAGDGAIVMDDPNKPKPGAGFEGQLTEDFPDFKSTGVWEGYMEEILLNWVVGAGVMAGEDQVAMANLFDSNWDNILAKLRGTVYSGMLGGYDNTAYWLQSSEGWAQLVDIGKNYYSSLNDSLAPFIDQALPRGGGRGGGGGGGSRALTAEEIRNMYDIDQLALRADDLKRGLVLEGFSDPRGVARAYVDKVVAGKGQVKIDFDTFVENQVRESGRFKSIYRNMPAGMNPRQYIAPLYQNAMAIAPDEAEARTIGAAQFGASVEEFQQRLRLTDTATGSAPVLNSMQSRLRRVKDILKG